MRALASKLSCQAVAEIVASAQLNPKFLSSRLENTPTGVRGVDRRFIARSIPGVRCLIIIRGSPQLDGNSDRFQGPGPNK